MHASSSAAVFSTLSSTDCSDKGVTRLPYDDFEDWLLLALLDRQLIFVRLA